MKDRDPRPLDEAFADRSGDDGRGRFGDEREARKSDLVDLALVFHGESPAAWLLSENGDRRDAKWAPKSLIEASPGAGVYTMPEWLAREKGWL